MIRKTLCLVSTLVGLQFCFPLLPLAEASQDNKPYAGQQDRQIKALSGKDVDDLLAGRGWGFAKSAELNGFPGPAHVLEAEKDLDLSPESKAKIQKIFKDMNSEARRLGALFVDAESRIEKAFASADVTPEKLTTLLAEAEALRAQLRFVHLRAHIETAPLLTRHQTVLYNRLRGYGSGNAHAHDGKH